MFLFLFGDSKLKKKTSKFRTFLDNLKIEKNSTLIFFWKSQKKIYIISWKFQTFLHILAYPGYAILQLKLKVKHLLLLPVIGVLQIYALFWYVNKADSIRLLREEFVQKNFKSPKKWQKDYQDMDWHIRVTPFFRRVQCSAQN